MSVRSASLDPCVVGIDDTDIPDAGGTGRLARRLAREIESLGLGRSGGVTRHQFYEGPGVPKTARNSAAAVAFTGVNSASALLEAACRIVARDSIAGSDPGVAIACGPVSLDLSEFARRTQTGLVTQAEARLLGDRVVGLVGLDGTEDGVIGALGAMALRLEGDDGRFVDLPGIREVTGITTVAEVLYRTAVAEVVDLAGNAPPTPASRIDLGDWVRPRLIGGRPVLVARYTEGTWVNADAHSR